MSTELIDKRELSSAVEATVIQGDLAKLNVNERLAYYNAVCSSVGLNPLTRPFDYITLNGKLTLYARKDATDQLRNIHNVSVEIVAREAVDDCYVVTSKATLPSGRTDGSIGAVSIANLKGEAKCNAMMKAETKAKRRVTLSICGLGLLDELEIETIPNAKPPKVVEVTTEDIPLGGTGNSAGAAVSKGTAANAPVFSDAPNPEEPPTIFYEQVKAAAIAKEEAPEEQYPGCIDKPRQIAFARAWDAAIPKPLAKMSEKVRHEWLARHQYTRADGSGTSAKIPMADFEDVKRDAVAFARGLKN